MNQENLNNNVVPEQPVQPEYTMPAEPIQETVVQVPEQAYAMPEQPVQPEYTMPTELIQETVVQVPEQAYAMPEQPVQPEYTMPTEPIQETMVQDMTATDSIDKVSNLNKEDAMEEALSHTNQYSPFEIQQEEVNQETNIMGNKKTLIFLVVILVIMFLFIIFLPHISDFIANLVVSFTKK